MRNQLSNMRNLYHLLNASTEGMLVEVAPTYVYGLYAISRPMDVAKAAERYIGRPASTENLKRLAAAMTRAYNRSSVALFTLVIPEQDFADGVVIVFERDDDQHRPKNFLLHN